MRICLTDGGKRFHRDWVFRHADMDLIPGRAYAITGPNGSGKSTLLQVLGGMTELSAGRIEYFSGDKRLEPGDERAHISFAAPYLETVEEMTGVEFLTFHAGLRPLLPGHTPHSILADVGLTGAADKQVRHYSSGMKQRLRLAQAFYSAGGALLLDEPCTNLDRTGVALYRELMDGLRGDRLVLVASNVEEEYAFCDEAVDMSSWKGRRVH
ncbi:MAG: ABC transporter ATP-binding protein [Chitinophagia bacterium]|nr:ABC transporter ATP-binding protein [Chitinophagia bacterium]